MTGGVSCSLLPWWRARHWFLASPEDLDDAHGTAAARARFTQSECGGLRFLCGRLLRDLHAEQRTYFGEVGLAGTAGQQTIMADAMETVRENVDEETADELGCGQAHSLLPIT